MKPVCILFFTLIFLINRNFSQEEFPIYAGEELVSESDDDESMQEESLQRLYWLRKHPINLNSATNDQLKVLGLTMPQINALHLHIQLFGPLVSVYELQAISHFSREIINRILPFVFAGDITPLSKRIKHSLKAGEHLAMIRVGQTLEKARGYSTKDSGSSHYPGSPQKLLLRYQFRSERRLKMGFTGKKDAGEQWFKGYRKDGFDFNSAHLFIQNDKVPYSFAVGDYSVQFGQGLIQWQGFDAGKSLGPIGINRQKREIQPYTGTGEFNFYRGAAFSLVKKNWKLTTFISSRKLNASIDTDTLQLITVSSLQTSGLNRTLSEISKRKSVRHLAYGGSIRYGFQKGYISANFLKHHFSLPFSARNEPYALFNLQGDHIANGSIDYGISYRNIYAFGEIAVDHKKQTALLNGMIMSLDPKIDIVLLHRRYNKSYASVFSSAFGQQALPRNESGLFIGASIRPSKPLQIELYADLATFPWLRFQMDAPGFQKEFFFYYSLQSAKECGML